MFDTTPSCLYSESHNIAVASAAVGGLYERE
jgi:hypothetical protein